MKAGYARILACALMAALACAGCAGAPATTSEPEASEQTQPRDEITLTDSQVRVSYLGPEGTYTQEACSVFFGGEGTYLPQADVSASVQALVGGSADFAVIPQENAIGGPIAEYLDEVIGHEGVSVVGEVELPISQNLLARPGVTLEDIHTVYSHKQGIAQGREWLEENLPNAEVIEVSSTAEGARMAAETEDGSCAAIGSFAAADVYGLEVVADNIQMSDTNRTRFYVLSTSAAPREPSDRMAFLASGDVEDLAELLASIESEDMEVVAVHDRPRKTELGSYTYLIECSGGGYEAFEAVAQDNPSFDFRYLGSFPVK